MRTLIALLCLAPALAAAQPLPGPAQPARGYEFFPHDEIFRAPVADPAAPRVYMSYLEVKRDAGDFSAGHAGLGYDFGLLRRQGARPDHGWQLGIFGSVDSLFNLDLPGDALVNTDYRLGVPLTWRGRAWSGRARLYHQSSHLGDELILGGNAPPRLRLSFEALDLLLAWERAGWRLYAGGGYVLRTSSDAYDGGSAQAGVDYLGPPLLWTLRVAAGLDVKWLEAADWRSGTSVKLGLMLGRFSPDRRGFTILAEAYDGYAPFGQFFVEDIKYYGVSLQFDF